MAAMLTTPWCQIAASHAHPGPGPQANSTGSPRSTPAMVVPIAATVPSHCIAFCTNMHLQWDFVFFLGFLPTRGFLHFSGTVVYPQRIANLHTPHPATGPSTQVKWARSARTDKGVSAVCQVAADLQKAELFCTCDLNFSCVWLLTKRERVGYVVHCFACPPPGGMLPHL